MTPSVQMSRPSPKSAFGSIKMMNATIETVKQGARMVSEMPGRSAEPVAKMCARPDPKQVMLKGGDVDVVAKCWMFTDSL